MRITNCMKRWSATARIAGKRITGGTNCEKRASVAGANAIAGGMKMDTVGAAIAIGTITITTATKTPRP